MDNLPAVRVPYILYHLINMSAVNSFVAAEGLVAVSVICSVSGLLANPCVQLRFRRTAVLCVLSVAVFLFLACRCCDLLVNAFDVSIPSEARLFLPATATVCLWKWLGIQLA